MRVKQMVVYRPSQAAAQRRFHIPSVPELSEQIARSSTARFPLSWFVSPASDVGSLGHRQDAQSAWSWSGLALDEVSVQAETLQGRH